MRVVPAPSLEDWRKWTVRRSRSRSRSFIGDSSTWFNQPLVAELHHRILISPYEQDDSLRAQYRGIRPLAPGWKAGAFCFTGIKNERWCRYKYDAGRNIVRREFSCIDNDRVNQRGGIKSGAARLSVHGEITKFAQKRGRR